MAKCKWIFEIERHFDGQSSQGEAVAKHLASCPACTAHWKRLEMLRNGIQASVRKEEIRDTQFAAFMDGIREGATHTPATVPVKHRWLAWMSLTAAALLVSIATFLVLTNGQKPVDATATVVESCTTDLEGGTVKSYKSETGVTTVWVTVTKDDVW